MPLQTYDTQINSVCQPFTAVSNSFDPKTLKSVYSFESNSQTSDMRCPFCGKMNVYVHARHSTEIKDFPFLPKHTGKVLFFTTMVINAENADIILWNLFPQKFRIPE